MRKFHQLRRFALALSGAQPDVLDLVPSERARFESLGWAVLITSSMAAVSMWFALASALGINGILAVPAALGWGLAIMGIDRWLITSMPVDGRRKFAIAVPRLLLALLLGTLISTPLVLRIFQSEISAQMAVMQQDNYNSFLLQQQGSQVSKQVTTYRNELRQLSTVIDSHGAQAGQASADPQLVAYKQQLTTLDAQLSHWTTLKATYYTDYTCQLYGGAQCPKKGNGPAAKASYQSYQQAAQQVTSYQGQISLLQGRIQQRDQVLNSTSKASQQQRYSEALSQRPVVQAEYNTAVQRQNQLQASYYAQEQASHGILMRLEALSQLSAGNPTVGGARVLLFLLFLVIECLPVTVKLLQRPGQYEAALREAKKAEERDFKKAFATRSRLASPVPAVTVQPGPSGPPFAPGQDPDAIWTRTRVLPMSPADAEDARPTEALPAPAAGRERWDGAAVPGDSRRRPRRWRGNDEFRNLWAARGDGAGSGSESPGREAPAGAGYPARPPARAAEAAQVAPTVIDRPPAPTRTDYRAAAPEPDGNGSGLPLTWDDE